MKIRYLSLLLCLSLATASLTAETPRYAVTLDGLYAKPFGSAGYSGQDGSGLGSDASFEWRRSEQIALGLAGHYLQLETKSARATFGGADLTLRWLPFSGFRVDPYFLLGAGWDLVQEADLGIQAKGPGFVGQFGLGLQVSLAREWAFEIGADYQARPATALLSTVDLRLGLQYRFDVPSKAGAAKP